MPIEHISLSSLNNQIKQQLNQSFPGTLWVVAEISEIRTVRSGHCYLELIEKDTDSDQIIAKARATIWSFSFRMIKSYFETTTGQPLTAGIKILLKASVEFQEVYGYSLNIKDIDPTFTLGDIARKKRETIKSLEADGVIDMNKELYLTPAPQKIAIISSPTAAGYEDFINQLDNNTFGFKVYHHLFPAIMQGEEAETSIISALERIFDYEDFFDAVVIIRGGGSTADLMCFDNYQLALNVAQFPLPVLSGIGHERDESVVDMVAHTRLKTPTAVAEFILTRLESFYAEIEGLESAFTDIIRRKLTDLHHELDLKIQKLPPLVQHHIQQRKHKVTNLAQRFLLGSKSYFDQQHHILRHFNETSKYLALKQIRAEHKNLSFITTKLRLETKGLLKNNTQRLTLLEKTTQLSNPLLVLRKGYSITSVNGKAIKSVRDINPGEELTTRLSEGIIISRVERIEQG